tara:strand:- start:60130 stop:60810 length:681 start_codon:yes stop_codon:yes gene_type:complete
MIREGKPGIIARAVDKIRNIVTKKKENAKIKGNKKQSKQVKTFLDLLHKDFSYVDHKSSKSAPKTYSSEIKYPDGMRDKRDLRIDFRLNDIGLHVEIDGSQHFLNDSRSQYARDLEGSLRRDLIKDEYCLRKGKSILRIPYNMSRNDMKKLVSRVINVVSSGGQAYYSYLHFYDNINDRSLIPKNIFWGLVPHPTLKFLTNGNRTEKDSKFRTWILNYVNKAYGYK